MFNRSRNKGIRTTQPRMLVLASQASMASTPHTSRLTPAAGFTLVEMIGVLAILAILASFITPNVMNQLRSARRDAEDHQLANIAQGIELFVRQNRSFPANLGALSPDFVPTSNGQLTNNPNGFLRYYFVQPNISGYSNATGLAPGSLADSRFLLITNLQEDAAPTITTDTQFETWWNTDETSTPDLKIYRGHVGQLFQLLSLSFDGAGGSYDIDGTSVNSGGSTLAAHIRYHVIGTPVGLDEANTFGTAETQFTMVSEAGYQFDPDCPNGSQWRVISSGCYSP